MFKKNNKIFLLLIPLLILVAGCNPKPENTIIEYGDYKCPYCKDVEKKIMPKLKKEYIDKNKADYEFKNVAVVGLDSIIGARAGNAVKMYAPDEYLHFQKLMFEKQPKNENPWITPSLVNKQIDKLDIKYKTKEKIKKEYNKKNSKTVKKIDKDTNEAKKHKVKTVPSVFINGEKVKDPHDYKEYKKLMKD